MARRLIRDLVKVVARPSVVRLEHLDEAEPGWISSSYHVTEAVQRHLTALRHALGRERGCGFFLIGHYGSGKSHFLAFLTQQVRGGRMNEADRPTPRVVTVSLLNFRAETTLEVVVAEALGLHGQERDRRPAWSRLAAAHPEGVVLVIDELSEFLRSKPSRSSFNEDVRFLQFMGEWAQSCRFWVLAAMQEQIEHTGALESNLYRKIKDRFPIRFLLTPEHVRDLLSGSLLVKEPGYEEAVEELASEVRQALPGAAIDFQALQDLYPVHPATLEMLEEVRELFSQSRGIVDFVITRMLGDSARGVEPFLDRPWGDLLTPEAIVDHFADLFEVQPDFLPLAQVFLPYYRKHAAELFTTEAQQALGWRLLKLLMLDFISPQRQGLRVQDASAWLLFRATSIVPAKNLQVVERLLRRLVSDGRYVRERSGRYYLDLRDDSAERLDARLQREMAELREASEDAVWEILAAALGDGEFNPFTLPRDTWHSRKVRWHHHERPYAVFFGNGAPPPHDGVALCIRLPWGRAGAAASVASLVPAQLELDDQLLELAALQRLASHLRGDAMQGLLRRRIGERRSLLVTRVRTAYLEAELTVADGTAEVARRITPEADLRRWLDGHALWLLRRAFPGFERFAPQHGELPKEAYRRLMQVATEHDLGDHDGDEHVKLIREAYLVPMGLMKREGWYYRTVPDLDRHDLVQLVLPLLEHRPAPRVVYDHLAGPVFGLVADQVHLLLIFLLLRGDIDIVKAGRSYRDQYASMPLPIQYDRVEHGRALRVEHLKALEDLCSAFKVRHAKQWTVTAQRKAVRGLQRVAKKSRESLHPVLLQLKQAEPESPLVGRLEQTMNDWSALEGGDDELNAFELFMHQVGSAARFIAATEELAALPDRLKQVLGELRRFSHLLADPVLRSWDDPVLQTRLEALGAPPGLDELAAVRRWLEEAGAAYGSYCAAYRERHDEWWREVNGHSAWHWKPPEVARSRHLGLTEQLDALRRCRERAAEQRCRGLSDLEFRPQCSCGFAGAEAPVAEALAGFAEARERIESGLRLFFSQDRVRDHVRSLVDDGIEVTAGTRAFLDGKRKLPEIRDVELFDRQLAGVELVQELPADGLLDLATERVWLPEELRDALAAELGRYSGKRLRFTRPRRDGVPVEVAQWCLERALRLAEPLPAGLDRPALAAAAAALRPEWVGPEALAVLEEMGLGRELEDRVLAWLLDGTLAMPDAGQASPLVRAACEVVQRSHPETGAELAQLAEALYLQHPRLGTVAGRAWLGRLGEVAEWSGVDGLPDLVAVLGQHSDRQWLVVDCLGLPLLSSALETMERALPDWKVSGVACARVGESNTDGFFGAVAAAGLNHAMEKVNGVDRLLHERQVPFADFVRLAAAELEVALRQVAGRLDAARGLLVFADHGFRLAADGRGFEHGGRSALEVAVPVVELEPRQG